MTYVLAFKGVEKFLNSYKEEVGYIRAAFFIAGRNQMAIVF